MNLDNNNKIWNICLLYEYIFSKSYVEYSYDINNSSEYFKGDLKNVINNIETEMRNFKDIQLEIFMQGNYAYRNR